MPDCDNTNNKIRIIGCGNVGSALIYNLCLYFQEAKNLTKIHELEIVDYGIVKASTLKSIFLHNLSDYIGENKAFVIKERIGEMFDLENVVVNSAETMVGVSSDLDTGSGRIMNIDCRDTSNVLKNTYLKISCEHCYGKIVLRPNYSKTPRPVRYFNYTLSKSHLYAHLMASGVFQSILALEFPLDYTKHEKIFLCDGSKPSYKF